MLLTITTTATIATDLGYLLHKNPASLFERDLPFGKVRVFYPEAEDNRCTAALLLDVDPIGLVRGRGSTLDQYVNDRPYVASSLMSVAIGEAFRTAMAGNCKDRPERVNEPMPLTATLAAVDCDGGEPLIRRIFEPLGYEVSLSRAPLDARFPQWGESSLYTITIQANQTVQNLLNHLYVLIPVLDNAKHYFVDASEIEKLMRRGEGWLASHPEKAIIARRYLVYKRQMVAEALELLREEGTPDDEAQSAEEESIEKPVRLNEARMQAVLETIRAANPAARSVLDLGCGEGTLLKLLLNEKSIERIVGVDVSPRVLSMAERRLKLERLPERQQARIQIIQGSLVYRDARFQGFDVATLVEVIEHLDPPRLASLEKVVFQHARPRRVIVTTPNSEYNSFWPTLPAGKFRHRDHRFEWTRDEFKHWASGVGNKHGYTVQFTGIGNEDPERGHPTQMAVFESE